MPMKTTVPNLIVALRLLQQKQQARLAQLAAQPFEEPRDPNSNPAREN